MNSGTPHHRTAEGSGDELAELQIDGRLAVGEPNNRFRRVHLLILLLSTLVAATYERWQGRVWWCDCGSWNPVALHVQSMHNSQHLLDAYSFSHLLHGLLFYGLFWFLTPRWSASWRFVAASLVEVAWEMLENSPIVIERYRTTTASLGYSGDSIANSISDICCFMAGFG